MTERLYTHVVVTPDERGYRPCRVLDWYLSGYATYQAPAANCDKFSVRIGKLNVRIGTLDSADVAALSVVPIIVGAIFWVSAWIHYRMINRDKPIVPLQRRLMRYWTCFVTGAGYALFVPVVFAKPKQLGVVLVGGWGLVLLALYRRRLSTNERQLSAQENDPTRS
jgi:hypothetical protein